MEKRKKQTIKWTIGITIGSLILAGSININTKLNNLHKKELENIMNSQIDNQERKSFLECKEIKTIFENHNYSYTIYNCDGGEIDLVEQSTSTPTPNLTSILYNQNGTFNPEYIKTIYKRQPIIKMTSQDKKMFQNAMELTQYFENSHKENRF